MSRSSDGLDLTIELPACPEIGAIEVTRTPSNYVITVFPQRQSCTPSGLVVHRTVRLPGPFPLCVPPGVVDGATGKWPDQFPPDATQQDMLSLMAACPKA